MKASMRRNLTLTAAGLALGFFIGCDPSDDDGSVESRLCERLDECNGLGAGYSVQDCTDLTESCVGDLLTSAQVDWRNAAGDCLNLANCQNFLECYVDSVDACLLGDGSGSGGDGDGSGGDGDGSPSSGGDSGQPPGECVETGEVCEANGDCCDFPTDDARCVDFVETIRCAATCATGGDCVSGCCLALEGDDASVCGPAELCEPTGPSQPDPDADPTGFVGIRE